MYQADRSIAGSKFDRGPQKAAARRSRAIESSSRISALHEPSGAAKIRGLRHVRIVRSHGCLAVCFHQRELMPTIAYFYGIAIKMYLNEHPPPHFTAAYSGREANVSIKTGDVIEGYLPPNAARLVKRWALSVAGEDVVFL